MVSIVSWFHRFPGVNGFINSWVSWCQWFHDFIGFVVLIVSWFHRFRVLSERYNKIWKFRENTMEPSTLKMLSRDKHNKVKRAKT